MKNKLVLVITLSLLMAGMAVGQNSQPAPATGNGSPSLIIAHPNAATSNSATSNSAASNAAPANTATADNNVPRGFQDRYPRYQIRPGDSFDLNFEYTPELNQTVVVQPDGFVTLREIGDVQVTGLTVPDLTHRLTTSYAKQLHDPVITVILKDFDKPYFIANGQVSKPGKYELRADTTLTEGIAIAGGFMESSKHSQVVLFRRSSNDMYEAKLIDVKKMMSSHDLREDEHLRPGDMIWVPQNKLSKIKKFLPIPAVSAAMNPATF
jgi:polysaccharide export outer membrane protein